MKITYFYVIISYVYNSYSYIANSTALCTWKMQAATIQLCMYLYVANYRPYKSLKFILAWMASFIKVLFTENFYQHVRYIKINLIIISFFNLSAKLGKIRC